MCEEVYQICVGIDQIEIHRGDLERQGSQTNVLFEAELGTEVPSVQILGFKGSKHVEDGFIFEVEVFL